MKRSTATIVILLMFWLIVAKAATASGNDRVSLYYKEPQRQPLVYNSTMQEDVFSRSTGEQPKRVSFRVEQTITNRYKLIGPETIAVKAQFTNCKALANGKDMAYVPPTNEAQRLMDVKGYRKVANKTAADFDKFDVILPNYPVAIGDSWTYTAPPTSDLPLYLVTKYTLIRFDSTNGRKIAVIDASTNVSEVEPIRRLKITVHAQGQILFSQADGILVSSAFKIDIITEPLAGTIGRITKRIKTSMKLIKG